MATGQVKQLYAIKPVPVLVVQANGRPVWSEIFENNPKILQRPTRHQHQRLVNAGGARPYIANKSKTRWIWKPGMVTTPGELFFSASEVEWARRYGGAVMIEPNVKANGHENKAWPFERWQEVIDRCPRIDFVQCGSVDGRFLRGVVRVETPSFRHAAAVLAQSRTFLGSEGGLMHSAAAVGKPSVILWSEFIDPSVTGYSMHRNIRHAGRSCGMRLPCASCAASMQAISVDEVLLNLRGIIG